LKIKTKIVLRDIRNEVSISSPVREKASYRKSYRSVEDHVNGAK